MHQIRIFKGTENDLGHLEQEINAWLKESQARVVNMFGNMSPQSTSKSSTPGLISQGTFAPSDVMLVVLYEADQ